MREASYVRMSRSGALAERATRAAAMLECCTLCPRRCGVDRATGELGVCGADAVAEVSSFNDHHGEEPPISGSRGSGTIFLTHCNLKCMFCQNYPISHLGNGNPAPPARMAQMMLALQARGCHNINLVTPTHFMPQILRSLDIAARDGLTIPLVYNCGGYESLDAVRLLDGIIDIYMPDMKYGDNESAKRFSGCHDYVEKNRAAVREMYRQVGALHLDDNGIARRGLLIRHLVLPNGRAGSRDVLGFIANELSTDVHISIMEQYFPAYKAPDEPEVSRRITGDEYAEVLDAVEEFGFTHGWLQGDPLVSDR